MQTCTRTLKRAVVDGPTNQEFETIHGNGDRMVTLSPVELGLAHIVADTDAHRHMLMGSPWGQPPVALVAEALAHEPRWPFQQATTRSCRKWSTVRRNERTRTFDTMVRSLDGAWWARVEGVLTCVVEEMLPDVIEGSATYLPVEVHAMLDRICAAARQPGQLQCMCLLGAMPWEGEPDKLLPLLPAFSDSSPCAGPLRNPEPALVSCVARLNVLKELS